MTFDEWFTSVVRTHYRNGKDFSDKEKFPLICVYRWLRGACLPRPLQISLICKIIAQKEFEAAGESDQIVYDLIYNGICGDVMILLEREPGARKHDEHA